MRNSYFIQNQEKKDPKHYKLAIKDLLLSTDILDPNNHIRKTLPKEGIIEAYPIQLDLNNRTISIPRDILNLKQRTLKWSKLTKIDFGISPKGKSLLIFCYKTGKRGKQKKCKRRLSTTDYKQLLPILVTYFGDKLNVSNNLGKD
ncbi:MAG: hypothetical protein AAF843_20855 [Bacteroidota bacterium]